MPNPNFRKCGWCGHAWGEHRLEDRVTPICSPCAICQCADFDHGPNRPTGQEQIGKMLDKVREEENKKS